MNPAGPTPGLVPQARALTLCASAVLLLAHGPVVTAEARATDDPAGPRPRAEASARPASRAADGGRETLAPVFGEATGGERKTLAPVFGEASGRERETLAPVFGEPMPTADASAATLSAAQAAAASAVLLAGEPSSAEALFGLEGETAAPAPKAAAGAAAADVATPPKATGGADVPPEPESAEALFGLEAETAAPAPKAAADVASPPKATGGADAAPEPESAEALFGMEPEPAPAEAPPEASSTRLFGFFQSELGFVHAGRDHWQKFRNTVELGGRGRFENGSRWVASARAYVDPVFAFEEYYPDSTRRDRGAEVMIREMYIDTTLGDWELRVGRQHVIWGEMVALFFADVVSARDLREFVLQDFDWMRIPQWAVRSEYFKGDFHAELLWIPYFTYDNIGDQADDYFPFKLPAGVAGVVEDDERRRNELDNGGYGVRANYLAGGWDMSAFYYTAPSLSPAFARSVSGGQLVFSPVRNREHQFGATLAKDFGPVVMKGEAVYTRDRLFETLTPTDADGVVETDFVSYIFSAEFAWAHETRFTAQMFQQHYFDHEPGMLLEETETGYTLLLATRWFHPDVEPELVYVSSLDNQGSMLQTRVSWHFRTDWRAILGADMFTGRQLGVFGRFDDTDRVYTELRYTF